MYQKQNQEMVMASASVDRLYDRCTTRQKTVNNLKSDIQNHFWRRPDCGQCPSYRPNFSLSPINGIYLLGQPELLVEGISICVKEFGQVTICKSLPIELWRFHP